MELVNYLPSFLLKHKVISFLCKVGLQTKIHKIKFNNDAQIFIDLMDPEPRNVFITKQFEQHFFDIANNFISSKGTIFDIGSNVGFCTFGCISRNPLASYYLFEANQQLIQLINESINLQSSTSIHLINACVTNKKGITNFYISKDQSGQSHVAVGNEDSIETENVVLDDFCENSGINNVDFAKVDLEGNELPALRGWEKFLLRQRVKALFVEVIPDNQARYNFSTFELLHYIETLGYNLYLCKDSDFGQFGEHPTKIICKNGSLTVAGFKAIDYPNFFSTDILAISNKYIEP